MFVAVYQKSLSLLYIDELLAMAKAEFAAIYQPGYVGHATYPMQGLAPFAEVYHAIHAIVFGMQYEGLQKF